MVAAFPGAVPDSIFFLALPFCATQVLLCMAEQIGKLTANVGGKQHAYELLIPLEQLVAVEENTVRRTWLRAVATRPFAAERGENNEPYIPPFLS